MSSSPISGEAQSSCSGESGTPDSESQLDAEEVFFPLIESIRDSLDEAILLNKFTQSVVEGLKLDHCMVELYNSDRTSAQITYESSRLTTGSSSHQRAIADFEDIYLSLLAHQSTQFVELVPYWHGSLTQVTWLACPIFDPTHDFGNLWFCKPVADYFSLTEQVWFQQIANQVAIAIRQSRLEQTQQNQLTELKKLNQFKEDVIKLISSNVLTPLTSIQLAVQTLDKLFTENSWLKPKPRKTVAKILGILQQECHRQATLTDQLMTLITPDLAQPLEPVLIDLRTWIPSVLRPFQNRIDRENLTLDTDIDDKIQSIECDGLHLESILNELMANAIKYTPTGKKILVKASQQDEQIYLMVKNTGIVIPAEHLPHIFDKFYRAQPLGPQTGEGTGLGLALVKQMVHNLGGQIQVTSKNKATTFQISLPRSSVSLIDATPKPSSTRL